MRCLARWIQCTYEVRLEESSRALPDSPQSKFIQCVGCMPSMVHDGAKISFKMPTGVVICGDEDTVVLRVSGA